MATLDTLRKSNRIRSSDSRKRRFAVRIFLYGNASERASRYLLPDSKEESSRLPREEVAPTLISGTGSRTDTLKEPPAWSIPFWQPDMIARQKSDQGQLFGRPGDNPALVPHHAGTGGVDLGAALNDLSEVETEARDAGYLVPTRGAIESARLLVREMFLIRPMRYHIYPMPDGEIAIDGGEQGTRIGVFCYPDGDVQYIGWVNGECHEEHSPIASDIPYVFLRRALSELEGD